MMAFGDSALGTAGPSGSRSVRWRCISGEPLKAPSLLPLHLGRDQVWVQATLPPSRWQHLSSPLGRWHPFKVGRRGEGDHPALPSSITNFCR